jgi:membrane protein DedA with SNARE-associated domain
MDFISLSVLPYLLLYKYTTLFLITFLAALALPLPSAPSLMAAAAFAGQGYLNISQVILVASLGNITGDLVGYFIARQFGKPILYRIGLRKILDSKNFATIESYIQKHPISIIFTSRVQVQATMAVNILAGLGKLPLYKFLPAVIVGEVVQVLFYAGIGYWFSSNWQALYALINQFSWGILLLIILAILIFWKPLLRRLRTAQ